MNQRLKDSASRVASLLEQTGSYKLALGESCTGGTVAAALIAIPGISRFFCGSAVTYRESAKVSWLGVQEDALHVHSPVSQPVTEQMARGLLVTIDEATLGAAITGHLGPNAPPELDGVIYSAVSMRDAAGKPVVESCQCRHLITRSRGERLIEASALLLEHLAGVLAARRQPAATRHRA